MSGLGRTRSVGLTGVAGFLVEAEAHVTNGLPGFAIGGLGDGSYLLRILDTDPAGNASGSGTQPGVRARKRST